MKWFSGTVVGLLACALLASPTPARAQGVTTGLLNGVVTDANNQPIAGAAVVAVHVPSGTSYEAKTRTDGKFSIPGMRVGGPYSVTVTYGGAGSPFEPNTQ